MSWKSKHPICERSCWCDLSDLWTFPTKHFDWTPQVISEPPELVGSLNAADDVTPYNHICCSACGLSQAFCCDIITGIKIFNYIYFVVCSQLAEANISVDSVTLTLPHWISQLVKGNLTLKICVWQMAWMLTIYPGCTLLVTQHSGWAQALKRTGEG